MKILGIFGYSIKMVLVGFGDPIGGVHISRGRKWA
jgi:hypothetical protein